MKTENKHQWIKIIAAVIVIFLLWGVKAGQSGEEKIRKGYTIRRNRSKRICGRRAL